MVESDYRLALVPVVISTAIGLFYLVVNWRIFNKARRSGSLLLLNFLLGASAPWILEADPSPWIWVIVASVSWLIGLGIVTTIISIIGRPGWWVLPYLLASVPAIALQIWGAGASAFEDPPEALAFALVAGLILAGLMFIPMYFIGMYDLGDAFAKSPGFRVGLMFLPFVFLPILAFDRSSYGNWGGYERSHSRYVPPNSRQFPGGSVPPAAPLVVGAPAVDGSPAPTIPPLRPAADDSPDAGWYPDPGGSTAQRWWDGSAWTDQLDPPARAAAAGDPPSAMR